MRCEYKKIFPDVESTDRLYLHMADGCTVYFYQAECIQIVLRLYDRLFPCEDGAFQPMVAGGKIVLRWNPKQINRKATRAHNQRISRGEFISRCEAGEVKSVTIKDGCGRELTYHGNIAATVEGDRVTLVYSPVAGWRGHQSERHYVDIAHPQPESVSISFFGDVLDDNENLVVWKNRMVSSAYEYAPFLRWKEDAYYPVLLRASARFVVSEEKQKGAMYQKLIQHIRANGWANVARLVLYTEECTSYYSVHTAHLKEESEGFTSEDDWDEEDEYEYQDNVFDDVYLGVSACVLRMEGDEFVLHYDGAGEYPKMDPAHILRYTHEKVLPVTGKIDVVEIHLQNGMVCHICGSECRIGALRLYDRLVSSGGGYVPVLAGGRVKFCLQKQSVCLTTPDGQTAYLTPDAFYTLCEENGIAYLAFCGFGDEYLRYYGAPSCAIAGNMVTLTYQPMPQMGEWQGKTHHIECADFPLDTIQNIRLEVDGRSYVCVYASEIKRFDLVCDRHLWWVSGAYHRAAQIALLHIKLDQNILERAVCILDGKGRRMRPSLGRITKTLIRRGACCGAYTNIGWIEVNASGGERLWVPSYESVPAPPAFSSPCDWYEDFDEYDDEEGDIEREERHTGIAKEMDDGTLAFLLQVD